MDKVAWIQWSAHVHTGKLPLTLLNLELIVCRDLPNKIDERKTKGERERLHQSHCLLLKHGLISEKMLGSNYKMQYPTSFIFGYFLHDA